MGTQEQKDNTAQIRCLVFSRTSYTARDLVLSFEEDMGTTAYEVERGISDATPYGYGTIWSQVGCDDFEGAAPDNDEDPEIIRAAYDLVAALDQDTLDAYDRNEAPELIPSLKAQAAALVTPGQDDTDEEEKKPDAVQCPKCQGRMGFSNFAHVPHKHVGGLCFLCDGKGSVAVRNASAYRAVHAALAAKRRTREQAAAQVLQDAEEAAHTAAFDRYGEEYRLVLALARFDNSATAGAVFDLNAYKNNDAAQIRRVRTRIPMMLEDSGLQGLGLEEIEALGTLPV